MTDLSPTQLSPEQIEMLHEPDEDKARITHLAITGVADRLLQETMDPES